MAIGCIFFLFAVRLLTATRTYRDPDIIDKIPEELRKSIDAVVAHRLRRAVSAHFEESNYISLVGGADEAPIHKHLRRIRRNVDLSTDNSTSNNSTTLAVFSQWGEYGECSAKCGGGQQVRYRTCLQGNCRQIGSFTEARECGFYPCVKGSYVLGSITAFSFIPIPDARMLKFFTIQGARYFGYITPTKLTIRKWSHSDNGYVFHQDIPVTSGVSFDIMNTYPRTYLVVIEKALMMFPGRFSKMYYYDPWNSLFRTSSPVTIDVWEPSAIKTFDVFGTAFLGIVNYQTKMTSNYGATNELLVCRGQPKIASCPAGSIITIASAVYGRVSSYECATGVDVFASWFRYFATCVVPGTKVKVSELCDSKESCELEADPVHFVDPNGVACAQTDNYLKITYTCSSISYMGMPIFYKWDGVGLSLISSSKLITYGATDIEAFSIHDQQYIAVANYRNDQNVHHLDSEVYMYNLDSERFLSLQKIRTDGAVDWEFFTIGTGVSQEYFLVVANHEKTLPDGGKTYEVDSVIYKWNWNLFVPFQCIRTYGARKWTALTGDKGRFTLSVSNLYGNATFYNYDGWRFNLASVQPQDEIFVNAIALYAHKFRDEPLFIVQNDNSKFNETRNYYKTTFLKTFPKHELLETTVRAVQEMNRSIYEIVLPNTQAFNESYKAKKSDIVFLDKVNFTGHKTFNNLQVKGNTTVDSASIKSVNRSPLDIGRKGKINALNQTISSFDGLLEGANKMLANVVTKSTEQILTSKQTFSNLNGSHLVIYGDLELRGLVNGINISDIKERAVYVNRNTRLSGNFSFHNISVRELYVQNTFNSIDPENIVTTDKNETVYGRKTFSNVQFKGEQGGDIRAQLVNGIDTKDILTVAGDQIVKANYVFNEGIIVIGNVSVQDTINNLNFTNIIKDTVMINQPGTIITAHKILSRMNVLGDFSLIQNATVNGIDVSDMLKIGFRLAADSFDYTVIFASNVTFLSNVNVIGSVNGVNMSDVVFTNVDSVISAPKVISGNLTSSANININGKINGIDLRNVLNTVDNQTISGRKTFTEELTFIKDVETNGLVDGINISDAYARSLMMNLTQNITAFQTFNNLTVNSLHCTGNCEIQELLSAIKFKCAHGSTDIINISGRKYFENLRVGGNVDISGSVNDIFLPGNLLVQGRNETISGINVFQQNVMVGNASVESINQVNISSMYKRALSKSNLTISSELVFKDDVYIKGNLSVTKEINGIDLNDVVLTTKDQTVFGRKTFKADVHVEKLIAKKVGTLGLIDGVNLTALEKELLTLSGNKIVKGKKIFEKGVSFLGNWSIDSLIDGVNITELYGNAMTLGEDQKISGRKTFKEDVDVTKNISVRLLVDNQNLTDLAQHAVYATGVTSNQSIDGQVTFENVTIYKDAHVSGLISGHNLSEIIGDTLMKKGNQIVTGKHHIKNLFVSGDVDVEGNVNNVDLPEEVIVLSQNTSITGMKTFTDGISMRNVKTDNINQVDLSDFTERVAFIDEPTLVTGNLIFASNITVERNVHVGLFINGHNLTNVVSTTLLKTTYQKITQPVHFEEAIFVDVFNTKLFNTVNFTDFTEHLVYKCSGPNKNISGYWSFKKVDMKGESKMTNLLLTGLINHLNITLLDEQTVKDFGSFTIYGLKTITGALTVKDITVGTINGFNFPNDFLRIDGDDIIFGKKVFWRDVLVNVNVTSKTLNGVNISELAHSIVQSEDSIMSKVIFVGNTTVKSNVQTKLLNGLNISADELLLSYGNQTITASKIFLHVYADGKIISGNNINGFDLMKMQTESFVSGKENLVKGHITIIGDVHIKGNLSITSLDGVSNISSLFYGFNKISSYLSSYIPHIYRSIAVTRAVITQLAASITNVHQSLGYFIEEQDIKLPYVSTSIDVLTTGSRILMAAGALSDADGKSCSNTSIFLRSRSIQTQGSERPQFLPFESVLSNAVTGVKLTTNGSDVTGSDRILLLTSSNRKNQGCLPGISLAEHSVTYSYTETKFVKYASTPTYRARGVNVFRNGNEINALFTNTYRDQSKCVEQSLHSLNNSFTRTGVVESCNVIKSIILGQDDVKTTIAILGSNSEGYRHLEIVDILRNGSTAVKQVIATYFASDVIHFTNEGWEFIVVANTYDTSEEALHISYTVPVAVYRFDGGLYKPYQDIKVWAALKMQPLKIGVYNYLAIATYNQEIVVLKHKGASKWNVVLKVPIQGYGSIKDLRTWEFENEVYMSVLLSDTWNMAFPSKIRVMKGFLTSVEGTSIMKRVKV